jgi:hypothetical protein
MFWNLTTDSHVYVQPINLTVSLLGDWGAVDIEQAATLTGVHSIPTSLVLGLGLVAGSTSCRHPVQVYPHITFITTKILSYPG